MQSQSFLKFHTRLESLEVRIEWVFISLVFNKIDYFCWTLISANLLSKNQKLKLIGIRFDAK